jgi:hypothetical protein
MRWRALESSRGSARRKWRAWLAYVLRFRDGQRFWRVRCFKLFIAACAATKIFQHRTIVA